MTKPGNALLKQVFEEHKFDNREWYEELPFHPLEPIRDASKFGPKDTGNFPGHLDTENMSPIVSGNIRERGIDAIAWYLPYRFYGDKAWGIYFDSFAMTRLSIEIGTLARRIDAAITNTQSRKVLYAEVMRHEIEHAIQELLLAKSLSAGTIDVPRAKAAEFSQNRSYRETIASHFEHLDTLQGIRGISQREINILRHVIETLGEPPVYEDWRSKSIVDLDIRYEQDLGVVSHNQELSNEVRELVGGKRKSKYLDIPTYSWKGNGLAIPLNGIDLRAQSLDCKKLQRFMVKDGLARYFNGELVAVQAPDHSLKIRNTNLRPIKFDCHDWDEVPERVIGQLAIAIGIKKGDFVERVRQYL
jgi:hypothetical protein